MNDEEQLDDAVRQYVMLAEAGPTLMKESWDAWAEVVAGVQTVTGTDLAAVEACRAMFVDLGERLTPAIWAATLDSNMAAAKTIKKPRWRKAKP